MSGALRAVYVDSCTQLGVRPNSGLVHSLGQLDESNQPCTSLDLRLNIVGGKGFGPLLEVVKAIPTLTSIDLSAQNLSNDSIVALCSVLSTHPALSSVDLSGNPITLPSAKHLLVAIRSNKRITSVGLKDTLIAPLALRWIENALTSNSSGKPIAEDPSWLSAVKSDGGDASAAPSATDAAQGSASDGSTLTAVEVATLSRALPPSMSAEVQLLWSALQRAIKQAVGDDPKACQDRLRAVLTIATEQRAAAGVTVSVPAGVSIVVTSGLLESGGEVLGRGAVVGAAGITTTSPVVAAMTSVYVVIAAGSIDGTACGGGGGDGGDGEAAPEGGEGAASSPKKSVGFGGFSFGGMGGGGSDDAGGSDDDAGSDADEDDDQDDVEVDAEEEERRRNAAGRVAGRRATVSGTSYDENKAKEFVLPSYPKGEELSKRLRETLWALPILSHLDDREIATVVAAMQEQTFAPGEIVYGLGSEDDRLYVVEKGAVKRSFGEESQLIVAGGSFGETSVMTVGITEDAAFAATKSDVEGTTPLPNVDGGTLLYSIDRETYLHIVRTAAITRHELYDGFLQNVGFLQGITPAERSRLCEALSPDVFEPGKSLIEFGSVGKWFYIITEGTVEVIGRAAGSIDSKVKVCEFGVGECVGELEFIRKHLCVADVVAVTEVRVARMSRRHFQLVMGPVTDVLKRISEDPTGKYTYYQKRTADGALDEEPEDAGNAAVRR